MSELSEAMMSRHSGAESFSSRIGRTLRRCWLAYMDWRLQRLAISRLRGMSDRELKDIGVLRSQIERAVRGSPPHPMLGWRLF